MRRLKGGLVTVLACVGVALAQAGALDDFVRLQVGSFTSEAQAKQDARYDAITRRIAEIWPGGRRPPVPSRRRGGRLRARFPCLEAARQFWHSPEYAGIRKLREGIAEFEVLVLPVPPIPK